jgi:PST family polysaccharide transporter
MSQVFRWAATILTARILLPSDYGIAGLAMVVIGFLHHVAEFGIGSAIIQQKSLPEKTIRYVGGASVIIALMMAVAMVAFAPVAVWFFDQPALRAVLPVMSLRLLIDAYCVVPRSVLARDLDFRRLSIFEGLESLLMAAVTVGMAWSTRSYWSFIAGNLAGGVAFAIMANRAVRMTPVIPTSLGDVLPQLRFGSNVLVSRLSWYVYSNADFAVVGRVMNATTLGLYSQAWNIAAVPAEKLSGMIFRVGPSVLASARARPGEMRRYYLMLLRGIGLVTFPVAVGLSLVSRELVSALLGPNWLGSVPVLQLLALFFGVRSVAALGPMTIIASGEPRVERNNSLILMFLLPPLFLIGSRWGIVGVAATWLLSYPLLFAFLGQRWVLRRLEIPVTVFLRELWPPFSGAVIMAGVVLLAGHALPEGTPELGRLLILSAVGAATYFLALRIFHRQVLDAGLRLIRNRGFAPSTDGASSAT